MLFILLILGNTVFTNLVVALWEKGHYAQESILKQYDSYIVLGGFNSWNKYTKMQDCNAAGDRLFNTLPYLQDSSHHLIVSGGSAQLYEVEYKEADICEMYLEQFKNIPAHIYYEDQSRNTKENIIYSRKITEEKGLNNICVISSAMHIPRVKKILRKQNLNWGAYGVESAINLNPTIYDYFIPQVRNLSTWHSILHEWIGYIVT